MTLLPGPTSTFTGAPEEQIVQLLARPGTARSVNRPVVSLADGRCVGYQASVRVADWAPGSAAPWFRAASESGLAGQLGALALQVALRERATLPGEQFLAVELTPEALGHRAVTEVLRDADDVGDLMVTLVADGDRPASAHPADHPVARAALEEFRSRGMLVAMPAGTAGLGELLAVERIGPDLILLPADLVRGLHLEPLRQRLIAVVIELAGGIGAATLAEEVETLDEARALRSAGVRLAQGWLFGRARPGFVPPAAEVCEWLRRPQL